MIDQQQIQGFCEWLHGYVGRVTHGLSDPGMIQLTLLNPGVAVSFPRYKIGDVAAMVENILYWAARGYNVYVQGRTIRSDLDSRLSPRLEDTIWVFALVIDYDGYGKAPFRESFAIQTSSHNNEQHAHCWYLTSLSLEQALAISPRIKAAAGADRDSGVITQDYRFPGTPNYPNARKFRDGRKVEPTFVIQDRWSGHVYSFEELDALLPPPLPDTKTTHVVFDPFVERSLEQISEHMWAKAKMADRLFRLPMNGDRSLNFSKACFIAFSSGLTPSEIERFILSEAKNGCASKWIGRGELRNQLANQWRDWSALRTKTTSV